MTTLDSPARTLDPVTFAVLRNALIASTRKASTAFRRTALLPILYEGLDYAFSLYDDELNLVAESTAVPLFAGALGDTVPRTVEEIGRDNLAEGDILLTNLPCLNGSHPPDGVLTEPVFLDGRLIAFFALRAHMGDLGGASFSPTTTTEMVQEGLLIPPLKFVEAGVVNDVVVKLIRANSRTPEQTAGDFLAGAGAIRIGSAALRALVRKHGVERYRAAVDGILVHGERLARQAVDRIPDGVYRAEGALDDNGILRGVAVPLVVTVTVAGSQLTIDTTGSAPEQKAPVNCPWAYTQAVARMTLKTLVDSEISSNSGEHRALTLIAPPGSIFNSGPTAASFQSLGTAMHVPELILAALAPALPNEIPAMSGDDQPRVGTLLPHIRTGRLGFSTCVLGPGFGARHGADGQNAVFMRQASGLRSVPAEVLETRDPTIRHRWALDSDSGGAGRWRGGLGVIEELEFTGEGVGSTSATKTSGAAPILGAAGGQPPPRLSGVRFYVGTDKEIGPPHCRATDLEIVPGDRSIAWSAGGAGYGDPRERDPELVARDLLDEYVSRESALERYGVVLDDDGGVDRAATAARRAR